MGFTRRAILSLAGLVGLAGCTAPRAETASNPDQANQEEAMTDRTPRHFNDNDELTSPIRLDDDDVVEKIDPETGDRIIEHEPSGNTWRYKSDGTFEAPSVSTDEQSISRDLSFDYSQYNPFPSRSFEPSGPPSFAPHPHVSNPVLEGSDITDTSAQFVADPYVVYENGTYHMFFEVYAGESGSDINIGHATSPDGLNWTYNQLVLTGSFNLSGSIVFKHDGTWYMTPSNSDNEFKIYTADSFPTDWSIAEIPSIPDVYSDPVPVYWDGRWWLWYGDSNDNLRLYYGDGSHSLTGNSWSEHPSSPVETTISRERPAGRPIVHDDYIDLMVMDSERTYGDKVQCLRVTDLSTSAYNHTEVATSPVIQANRNGAWNDDAMHHVDAMMSYVGGNNIVAVDGRDPNDNWSIGVYTLADQQPVLARAHPASKSTVQTVDSETFDRVELTDIEHDTAQSWDLANNKYVVPESGYYELTGRVQLNDVSSPCFGVMQIERVGGSGSLVYASVHASDGTYQITPSGSVTKWLDEGDELIMTTYQNSGGTAEISRSEGGTTLDIQKVK